MKIEGPDPYDVFGLSSSASQSDIKRKYYKLAKALHPDVNQGDQNKAKRFQQIVEAYEVLGNSEKKKAYDRKYPDVLLFDVNPEHLKEHRSPTENIGKMEHEIEMFGFRATLQQWICMVSALWLILIVAWLL